MSETIQPDWPAPPNVCAFTTTRRGGFSHTPYDGLNIAQHVGDSTATVEKNRKFLIDSNSIPRNPDWLEQTHSVNVAVLEDSVDRKVDAAVTREVKRVVSIMTADCLPILLTNLEGTEVAGIHAGWRGLVNGIVESTVGNMHSQSSKLIAWIGPAISQQCFEVGDEVRNVFLEKYPHCSGFFESNRPGHYLFDLAGVAEQNLKHMGLAGVYRDKHCSFRDEKLFYSYRRQAVTGRMASLIWITS